MSKVDGSSRTRKPRVDAERNRLLLLETAKSVFAEKGAGASLDEIARIAGVGPGTLYRHFPTRDALVVAVYKNELEQLLAAAERLMSTESPQAALRDWLLLFVDYIATKHGMREMLNSMGSGTADLYSASTAKLRLAVSNLVNRGVATGDLQLALDPLDLLRALAGVANANSGSAGERAAKSMVDILVAGIKFLK